MELENRYIVIKRKDLRDADGVGPAGTQTAIEKTIDSVANNARNKLRKKPLECIVIESDWPEYPVVMKMLSDRTQKG